MNRTLRMLPLYVILVVLFGAGIISIVRFGSTLYPVPTPSPGQNVRVISPEPSTPNAAQTPQGHASLRSRNALPIMLLQLIVIMLSARGMGKIFRRLGQPSVIGEVVAGILMGPSLLGGIFPAVQAFIFPPSSLPQLQLFSQIGVILFMFIVGIDLNLGHLKQELNAAVLVSHASIIVPFFLGVTSALYIFPILAPPGVPFSAFALFIGVAMSITAFPVLARIVTERRLLKTPIGSTVIACAAVDDVTAWCLLAVIVSLISATALSDALLTVGMVLLFIFGMLFVVRPQIERLFTARAIENQRVGRVSVILAFAFGCALITETIGIHPLFGAFLAGVSMSSGERIRKFVKARLEVAISVILLPLFFAFTGLRTQVGLLNDWHNVLMGLGIIAIAILGKLGGSTMAARWTGMSWHDSLSIGTLMNTRGLVELIALNIGYDLGILSPRIFTMMVLMALVTTLMAGPVLTLLEAVNRRRAPRLELLRSEATGV